MGISGGVLVVGVSEAGGELAANHGSAAVSSSRGVKFPSSLLDSSLDTVGDRRRVTGIQQS